MLLERHRFGSANTATRQAGQNPVLHSFRPLGSCLFCGRHRGGGWVRCKRGPDVDQMKPFEVKELLLWCHVRSMFRVLALGLAQELSLSPPDVFLGGMALESQ